MGAIISFVIGIAIGICITVVGIVLMDDMMS